MNKIANFDINEWVYISGQNVSWRNKKTAEEISQREYENRRDKKIQYDKDYRLIYEFRRDCLPFGEYPDYVIQEFLLKRYE